MRMKLGYALVAALIIVVTAGSAVYGASQHGKPKIVTRTVYRNAAFDGTPQALAQYLHPQQSQQGACPKQYPGARCFLFAGQTWVVSAVISAGGAR